MTENKGWNFDNSYTRLPDSFYKKTTPTPVSSPKLVVLNESLAKSLGLNPQRLNSEEGTEIFGGNKLPEGSEPIAQAYAGHQFGHFTMLGDGRAVLLGEHLTPEGNRFDIQLKGAGRTHYSRGGDGRAALGPMLREYIISEAMDALGIPTTRSLAVVTTGESIIRETDLTGAILTRVAASHLRVGTFQYAAALQNIEELQTLAEYAIVRHYPEIENDEMRYGNFLYEVVNRQADLITKWMLVGFIHGVMNTDNMTISGETIDYGPCAFMDTYDTKTVFSSIDTHGRYAYENQPRIGMWNLARFAESLLPLINQDEEKAVEIAQNILEEFPKRYEANWLAGMRAKLGLFNEEDEDRELINNLLDLLYQHKADYTNTFRSLTMNRLENGGLFETKPFQEWNKKWQARLDRQEQSREESLELMKISNPAVIPRNHRVEEALTAAKNGDLTVMHSLLNALADPYDYDSIQEEYCSLPEPSNIPYRTFCGT
ncbi:protein adenylyltransferase SelO [Ureibacillus sp. MALMAid1270]|uniref:protein adenylyltransferase SelO n=1 Tax=Ureibacillus sp. MALMAid1270 TaxID=3411629 RepID=UPI003BA66911